MDGFLGNPLIFWGANSESYPKRILILPRHAFCILNNWRCDAIGENHAFQRNGFSIKNYRKIALIFEWNWWYHLQIGMSSSNAILHCIQPEFQALFLSLSLSSFHHYNPGRPQKNYSHHPRKSTTKPIDWPSPGTMVLSNLLSNSTISGWVSFKGLILRRNPPEV